MVKPSALKKSAEGYREYITRTLTELIQMPSLSRREGKVARFLEREFSRCGADEVQIDGLGNVLARLGSTGPVIAFDGHMDTVNIGQRAHWNLDPYSGKVEKGRIYGRGAADQKAGLAAMLTALKLIRECTDDFPFTLFFVASVQEEECDGLNWQYIIKETKITPDLVVLTEPTDGRINRGQRGRMEMELIVQGVSCHGATPQRGDNAIYKLMPAILALENLDKELPVDPFLGKGSLAVTRIRSDAPSLNAVADLAAAYIDRRLTKDETPKTVKEQIESLMEVQLAGARIELPVYEEPSWRGTTYATTKTFPSWVLDESHHLIDYAGKCHKQLFGKSPKIGKWDFSTNGVATMGMYQIPTFGYGPGDEKQAHTANESVAIDDIIKAAAFYAYFPWIVTGI
jgi:putative selenium metabolism hydrolase